MKACIDLCLYIRLLVNAYCYPVTYCYPVLVHILILSITQLICGQWWTNYAKSYIISNHGSVKVTWLLVTWSISLINPATVYWYVNYLCASGTQLWKIKKENGKCVPALLLSSLGSIHLNCMMYSTFRVSSIYFPWNGR